LQELHKVILTLAAHVSMPTDINTALQGQREIINWRNFECLVMATVVALLIVHQYKVELFSSASISSSDQESGIHQHLSNTLQYKS